jgi:hypothetical protein
MNREFSEADEVALVMRESLERARRLVHEAHGTFGEAQNRSAADGRNTTCNAGQDKPAA